MPQIQPTTPEAYQLMHEGLIAFCEASRQGICIDIPYCKKQDKLLKAKIKISKKRFMNSETGKLWKKSYHTVKLTSNDQLKAILYDKDKLAYPVTKRTDKGNPSVDNEVLEGVIKDIPELEFLSKIYKYEKIRSTYLRNFLKEQVNGVMHPGFSLHIPRTFRSCIAGYEKVLVMRDFESNPEGIPIKDIKKGDKIYCFDNNLNPVIKPVIWQGKTGHREIIRVHYYRKGKKGHFDCTPEHKVRLINGKYVKAEDLLKKQHYNRKTKNEGKCRVLACSRGGDRLNFTGHIKGGRGLLEHRFIYKNEIGPLKDHEIVHHKNKNHFDHLPLNLKKMTLSEHSKLHVKDTVLSIKSRKNNKRIVKQKWANGEYNHIIKTGEDHCNYLHLSKKECLIMLHSCKGQIKITSDKYKITFNTFKKYLVKHEIDWKQIKSLYDKHGNFISRGRLIKLSKLGRSEVSSILGHNYYKLLKLYLYYGIDTKRKWGNQFGAFKPGNHVITKIEKLNRREDVYDIEVKDCNNFFINEICVHNSSQNINFQQIPNRDPESKKICRGVIIPRNGRGLLEADFSSIEVGISCAYHKDKNMINYVAHPEINNMHTDMAVQIYMLDGFQKEGAEKTLRKGAKNGFVFPQFYGDYYGNNALSLATWGDIPQKGRITKEHGLKLMNGLSLGGHLNNKGIKTFDNFLNHIKEIEKDFWGNRFKKYGKWKVQNVKDYYKKGYLQSLTGFTCSGLMSSNDINNYGIQGSAFHCNLKCFIELSKQIKERGLKSRLIGQIHDSMIIEYHPNELQTILSLIKFIATEWLLDQWKWINVPMEIEAGVMPVDGNWASSSEVTVLRA